MMFEQHVKEFLRDADSSKSFIYHRDTENVDVLALVIKKKCFPFIIKYEVLTDKFSDLIPNLSVEVTEEDFVKDYTFSGQISVSGSIQGGSAMVSAAAKAEGCIQQESSAVTIKMKKVDLASLKKGYSGQMIDETKKPELKKGEVLGFIDRIIYNADEVKLHRKSKVGGNSKVSSGAILDASGSVERGKETGCTVPAGRVYAHGFNEIKFQDNEIKNITRRFVDNIPWHNKCLWITAASTSLETETFEDENSDINDEVLITDGTILAPETFEADNVTENTYENLQQIQDEFQKIEGVLQPLSHVPRATRSTLFQRLCQVSEEKDAVTALTQALGLWYEQQRFHLPQSPSACSTLELLRLANALMTGSADKDCLLRAFYMLVSAMDMLPDHMPAMIAKCSPDTLRALNHLVSSIRDSGEAQVTQPLPGPLQEGGELHWLTEFLCSTDETLQDLDELTMATGQTPGVLLLALCITVRGLHMMQGEQNEPSSK